MEPDGNLDKLSIKPFREYRHIFATGRSLPHAGVGAGFGAPVGQRSRAVSFADGLVTRSDCAGMWTIYNGLSKILFRRAGDLDLSGAENLRVVVTGTGRTFTISREA